MLSSLLEFKQARAKFSETILPFHLFSRFHLLLLVFFFSISTQEKENIIEKEINIDRFGAIKADMEPDRADRAINEEADYYYYI